MTFLPEDQRDNPYADYGKYGSVLVLNSGSSSLKYQLVNPAGGDALAAGIIERIGEGTGIIKHTHGDVTVQREEPVADHAAALRKALALFAEAGPDLADAELYAVGHRVVQGGRFSAPTVIDDDVVREVLELAPLAPLHNPANAQGIQVAQELFPDVPHVAVFDSAFFTAMPAAASTYAIDREIARKYSIHRYGYHGTSHQYVSAEVARLLGKDVADLNTIVAHLGNGASVSAVRGGVPADTSMGLTPLEGLVMGTRPGDIDPGILIHLARNAKMSVDDIDTLLNKRSGIKGLSGVNDFRVLHQMIDEGDADARLAFDVYVHRLKKYIGAYMAVLGRVDVVAFTAGVGENDALMRADVLGGLEPLGIVIDPELNTARVSGPRVISAAESSVLVLVVPTMEELAIARLCVDAVG